MHFGKPQKRPFYLENFAYFFVLKITSFNLSEFDSNVDHLTGIVYNMHVFYHVLKLVLMQKFAIIR